MVDIPAQAEAEELQKQSYDAGDPEQVSKARKSSGRNRRKRLEFVQQMMSLPEGRKWLYEFMDKCHVHGNPVVQGDPYMTHFNCGMQNAGKMILADTQEFSDLYVLMMKEAKEN